MVRSLSDLIIEFICSLRAAGVRISVAESVDAMRAIGAAGLALTRMREALRAALIKDEADNLTFDTLFADYFRTRSHSSHPNRQSRGAQIGLIGGRGGHAAVPSFERPASQPDADKGINPRPTDEESHEEVEAHIGRSPDQGDSSAEIGEETKREGAAESGPVGAGIDEKGHQAELTSLRRIEHVPFANYTPMDYEQARETLAILRRRWQIRLGRRLKLARVGRIDFRRTLRSSLQHGGVPLERRFRARRPRHLDLVVLADISGSVQYASLLILELLAGAARDFRRMHGFVFIDRLATADFEGSHLVMTPDLDLYARSDFGRVFGELRLNHNELLNRSTVLVILGDARNNKRPPRTDLLRNIRHRCRAVVWLNPEPRERWGTGDSVIEAYRRVVNYLFPCGNLHELQSCLLHIV
jgi:uncharacterized protein with von Willebrand factor type A (vWA) domain